jgi:Mg-chelatase subunit ChlD
MIKKRNVKGMSTIVATLLIILLSMVAIGIIWFVVRGIITNQSETLNVQKEFLSEKLSIVSLNVNGNLVTFSLQNKGGQIRVNSESNGSETEETIEVDIISVVDVSGSMLASCNNVSSRFCCENTLGGTYTNGNPRGNCTGINSNKNISCVSSCTGIWEDKLASAKEANKELISILSQSESNRIGLVVYGTNVNNSASLNLTSNVTLLNNKIDSWQIVATSYTCICCGINDSVLRLTQQSSEDKAKVIIVMSDGEANYECTPYQQSNTQGPIDAIGSSCNANRSLNNLVVHSIGLGQGANETTLRGISNCGGGRYFSAANVSDIIEVYKAVAEDIRNSYASINKFNYLYVMFYSGTSSYKERISDLPDPLVMKDYHFDLTGKLEGNITKIEIYPVILSDSGKEVLGPLFDSWEP